MLFSLLKHHLDLNITDTALKLSQSLYCFTTSISHGVENYFPRLWGTGISDAIFTFFELSVGKGLFILKRCFLVMKCVYNKKFPCFVLERLVL